MSLKFRDQRGCYSDDCGLGPKFLKRQAAVRHFSNRTIIAMAFLFSLSFLLLQHQTSHQLQI
jgi:hypothetical protein